MKQAVLDAGFSLCEIARVRTLSEHEPFLEEWLRRGYESEMEYMRRNPEKRLDPRLLVEGAKTVVVCAVNYKNTAWNQTALGRSPMIASYAYARDYHATIKGMLSEVLARVRETYPAINGRYFTDSAPLLEKAWAVEAGLGWTGKNSLLVTPRYGSFVLLGELVLDVECDKYDVPYSGEKCADLTEGCEGADERYGDSGKGRGRFGEKFGDYETEYGDCKEDRGSFGDGCGTCTRCIDSCPTGAIRAPGVIDTRRCISRLTIERLPEGVDIAENSLSKGAGVASDALHGWIFGCDECQSCCPRNARSPLSADPRFAPVIDPRETTQDFWQNLSEEEFDRIFGETPLARSGYAAVRSRIKNA